MKPDQWIQDQNNGLEVLHGVGQAQAGYRGQQLARIGLELQRVHDQLQRQESGAERAPVQVRLKSANRGKIARAYQDRANAFEESLGLYAFHHPKANAAAVAMSDRIRQYI